MDSHLVHRLQCYKINPTAINGMSYNKEFNLIAVLRNDNRIEIWNVIGVPFIQCTILLSPDTKLKGIAWFGKRLFGADLNGFIREMDLATLKEKNSYPIVSGGPCHCISINQSKKLIAVGTELGFVNVFSINEDDITFDKLIRLLKKRILSICWDKSGDYIVCGGVSLINLFRYEDKSLVSQMKAVKLHKKISTVLWCVAITDDLTVISGDSNGFITFWQGTKGICMESIRSLGSDVLALCLSEDQSTVLCSGIDPIIKVYHRLKMKDNTIKWIRSREIVNHTHDVNSLIQLKDGRICSGGVDSYLTISSITPYSVYLYPPLFQAPNVHFSIEQRFILLQYSKHLELWHLRNNSDHVVQLDPLIKMVELRSLNDELIRCASISDDGNIIVYATNQIARVFRFIFDGDKPVLKPLSINFATFDNIYFCCFSKDSQRLIVSNNTNLVQVFSTSSEKSNELSLLYNVSLIEKSEWSENFINFLCTSYNGEFIAVAGWNNWIGIWKRSKFHGFLPKYQYPATACAFHPRKNLFYVIYSDYKFVEYSLEEFHYTSFSKSFDSSLLEKYFGHSKLAVTNITFDHDKDSIIILQTSSTICLFDKNKVVDEGKHAKKKIKLEQNAKKIISPNKWKKGQGFTKGSKPINLKIFFDKNVNQCIGKDLADDFGFHVYEKYQHLVHFDSFGSKELIAIEINPNYFLEHLPPAFRKERFGQK